ncbi:FkbM family methyltransferase [Neobacillus niacini]|uniref:FkbM family methyltransferase n=1 Tax=Neobacillus niacini TaxID=86668 RepID=UPI00285D19FF|nr:FkbM family methyltransferase [Neobacillus niacini]MDR6999291.1 FkbM family methyltransferase [Neobacillus niacini]
MLVSTAWGGKLIVPSEDLSLTPELMTKGQIEVPLTNFFIKSVKPGDRVIDVGANVGYYSVLLGFLAGSTGKLFAYEANPYLYGYLMDNLSLNYLHDRTTTLNLAVHSQTSTISFFQCKKYLGNSSIYQHAATYKKHYVDEIEKIEVSTAVLDKDFKNVDQIDYLKIDIEGGEFHAFKGMSELIVSGRLKTIVFELNPTMLQADWEPFCALLLEYKNIGKQFFILNEMGDPLLINLETLLQENGHPHILMK